VGYPHEILTKWRKNLSKFDGIESHAIQHIVSFLEYVLKVDVTHEDILIKLFVFSLEIKERIWVSYCSGPKRISFYADLFKVFFKHWGSHLQKFEDVFEDYITALQEDKGKS
jgi:hypothetical protein